MREITNDNKKKKDEERELKNELINKTKENEKIKNPEEIIEKLEKLDNDLKLVTKIEAIEKWEIEIKKFEDKFKDMKEKKIIKKIGELNDKLNGFVTSTQKFVRSIEEIKENVNEKR